MHRAMLVRMHAVEIRLDHFDIEPGFFATLAPRGLGRSFVNVYFAAREFVQPRERHTCGPLAD